MNEEKHLDFSSFSWEEANAKHKHYKTLILKLTANAKRKQNKTLTSQLTANAKHGQYQIQTIK